MNEELLKIADGLLVVAEGIRAMAGGNTADDSPAETHADAGKAGTSDTSKPETTVTIEDVRAVLAAKSQDGKTKEVKALLMKYDAGKLSGVKPEDYAALLKEAEAL